MNKANGDHYATLAGEQQAIVNAQDAALPGLRQSVLNWQAIVQTDITNLEAQATQATADSNLTPAQRQALEAQRASAQAKIDLAKAQLAASTKLSEEQTAAKSKTTQIIVIASSIGGVLLIIAFIINSVRKKRAAKAA